MNLSSKGPSHWTHHARLYHFCIERPAERRAVVDCFGSAGLATRRRSPRVRRLGSGQAGSWERKSTKMTAHRGVSAVLLATLATIFLDEDAAGESAEMPPLQLEAKISLGGVRGRMDHMAGGLAPPRLFFSALGEDSLRADHLENPPPPPPPR